MHESLVKEINELLALIGEGMPLITHVSGGYATAFWQHGVPPDVRADVTRAVREALLERREAIRKENARRLLEDDARRFRDVLELVLTDTLEINDGKRTVSVSGDLALVLLKALKNYVSDQLDVTLRSLAAMDDDEEGDDDD